MDWRCIRHSHSARGFRRLLLVAAVFLAGWPRPARAIFPVDRKAPIFAASADGDIERLKGLLDKQPELLEYKGPFGITPLIVAAGEGQVAAVQLLLDRGADVRANTIVDGTALHAAVSAGQTDVVRLLLKRGAVASAKGMSRSETPLHLCATQGDLNIARMLIDAGAPINVRTEQLRETPLMAAAAAGHADIVRLLLANGALMDDRNYQGDTALSLAARRGRDDVVAALVGRGADAGNALGQPPLSPEELKDPTKVAARAAAVATASKDIVSAAADGDLKRVKEYVSLVPAVVDARGPDGRGVLHAAILGKHADVASFLLDHGAQTQAVFSPIEGGPLNWAVRSGSREIVDLLLSRHMSVNGSDGHLGPERTPLCTAVETGSKDMVQLLLARGADVNRPSWPDVTPLHLAAATGDVDMARILLDAKANIDAHGESRGITPLYDAATAGQVRMVEFLLDRGADAKTSFGGQTVLTAAAFAGKTEVIELLTFRGFQPDVFTLVAINDVAQLKAKLRQDPRVTGARDGFGRTPMHLAASQANVKAIGALLDAGADVNARDRSGATPLQAAVGNPRREGDVEGTMRLLLEKGADVNARDDIGRTPLDGPIMNPAIRGLLIEHGAKTSADLGPIPRPARAPSTRPSKSVRIGAMELLPGGQMVQAEEHVRVTFRNEDGTLRRVIEIEENGSRITASILGGESHGYTVTHTAEGKAATRTYSTAAAMGRSDPEALKLYEKYDTRIELGELRGEQVWSGPMQSARPPGSAD